MWAAPNWQLLTGNGRLFDENPANLKGIIRPEAAAHKTLYSQSPGYIFSNRAFRLYLLKFATAGQKDRSYSTEEHNLIDYREARSLVLQYLEELDAKDREIVESRKSLTPRERKVLGLGPPEDDITEVVIVEDDTMQIEGGWVFFCQSKKFLETGDSMDMLVGDGPIIVSSSNGALHTTGSAHPPEFYIKNFQKCGRPNG
jgi:hypothetical protein